MHILTLHKVQPQPLVPIDNPTRTLAKMQSLQVRQAETQQPGQLVSEGVSYCSSVGFHSFMHSFIHSLVYSTNNS